MTVKEKKAAEEKKVKTPKKEEKTQKTEKTEAKEKQKKETTESSKTYMIPLKQVFRGFRTRRAKHASRAVKEFLKKHLKTEVKLDSGIGEFLHSAGKCNIPRRVKVIVSKEGDQTTAKLAE